MKKYIALLTALSILAANGTTVVSAVSETSDGNSETVSVSESEKKECLISINDNYNVAIDIQTDSKDMTDSEYTEFAEKVLSPVGVAEFKCVKKYNRKAIEISANVSSEQLIGICAIESVAKVSGTDGLSPTAEPTEEPTSDPTSAPSVIPTFAPDFGPKTGDVN